MNRKAMQYQWTHIVQTWFDLQYHLYLLMQLEKIMCLFTIYGELLS